MVNNEIKLVLDDLQNRITEISTAAKNLKMSCVMKLNITSKSDAMEQYMDLFLAYEDIVQMYADDLERDLERISAAFTAISQTDDEEAFTIGHVTLPDYRTSLLK